MSDVRDVKGNFWDLLKVAPFIFLSVLITPIALMPPKPDAPVAVVPMPFLDRGALRAHIWSEGGYILDEVDVGLIALGNGVGFLTALREFGPVALFDASKLSALCGVSQKGSRDV